ncbi:hypothetical protein RhiirC2_721882, partial [Rhizophagus irregularis]
IAQAIKWYIKLGFEVENGEDIENAIRDIAGWALKENEKTKSHEPAKRMTAEVKRLLEIMFYTGTANLRQKMNAQQMHEELLQRVHQGELSEGDVPKVSTIQNLISGFSRR